MKLIKFIDSDGKIIELNPDRVEGIRSSPHDPDLTHIRMASGTIYIVREKRDIVSKSLESSAA
jgi:uncharacterized protein YlzI (FlbEa/FlbD family)